MANRYTYQFNGSFKPKMSQIEGFVSIGTGGLPNSVIAIASGGSIAGHSGTYYGLLPGCATTGVPTGWVGTFSGAQGLYGAGVDGVSRVSTGLYSIKLSDDWVRLDSCQITPVLGAVAQLGGGFTGVTMADVAIAYHTVGLGNTITTGTLQAKNQIFVQFSSDNNITVGAGSQVAVDLPVSSGFFVDIRVRDSLAGSQ